MIGPMTKCYLNMICNETGARNLIKLTNDMVDESKSSPLAAFTFFQLQSLIALGRHERINTDDYLEGAKCGYAMCAEGDSLKSIRAWYKRTLKNGDT